jgi:hypothetical protein
MGMSGNVPTGAKGKVKRTIKEKTAVVSSGPGVDMPGAERKILAALASSGGSASKKKTALLAGYSHKGGGFNNPLGQLRTKGWITPARVEPIGITSEGMAALGEYERPPSGEALLDYWLAQPMIGKAESRILTNLFEHEDGLGKQELADLCEYDVSGGGFNNPLGKLRRLDLISPARVEPITIAEEFIE